MPLRWQQDRVLLPDFELVRLQQKGLGLALEKPLVAIPTVDALAYNLYGTEGLICPLMDARRNQVYTGIYAFESGNMKVLEPQMAVDIEVIAEKLCRYGRNVVFLGDGVPVFRQKLESGLLEQLTAAGNQFAFAPAHVNNSVREPLVHWPYSISGRAEQKRQMSISRSTFVWHRQSGNVQKKNRQPGKRCRIRCLHDPSDGRGGIPAGGGAERLCFSTPWSENSLKESLVRPEYLFLVEETGWKSDSVRRTSASDGRRRCDEYCSTPPTSPEGKRDTGDRGTSGRRKKARHDHIYAGGAREQSDSCPRL